MNKQSVYVSILLILSLLNLSCSFRGAESDSKKLDYPSFSIQFLPEDSSINNFGLTIYEYSDKLELSDFIGNNRTIKHNSEYQELKKMVATSKLWTNRASNDFFEGPWSGPPRDIVLVIEGNKGLHLQGDKVPKRWTKSLLSFSQKYLRKTEMNDLDISKPRTN